MAGDSAEEILVGLITKRPPAGGTDAVEVAGSLLIDDLEHSQRVGEIFYGAAEVMGLNPPAQLLMFSGEIFYRDLRLEEVRLHGLQIHEGTGGHPPTASFWSTPTRPRSALTHQGMVELHPEDRGRTYIAVHARFPGLSLAWDLRGNASAREGRVVLSLFPQLARPEPRAARADAPPQHVREEPPAGEGEEFVPREEVEEVALRLEEAVRHRPASYVKEFAATIINLGPGERHQVSIRSEFGDMSFDYDTSGVAAALARQFVRSLEVTEEDVRAGVERSGSSRERVMALMIMHVHLMADRYARLASRMYAANVEGVLQNALRLLFDQIHVQALGELNEPALVLPDDPKHLKSEVVKASERRTKEQMGLPVDAGRPPGSAESADTRARKKAEFEAEIEEKLLTLKGKEFTKTDVARLVMGEYDTCLQAFNRKLSRLRVDYEEILPRVG